MVRVDGGVAMAAKLAKEGIFVEVHVSLDPVVVSHSVLKQANALILHGLSGPVQGTIR